MNMQIELNGGIGYLFRAASKSKKKAPGKKEVKTPELNAQRRVITNSYINIHMLPKMCKFFFQENASLCPGLSEWPARALYAPLWLAAMQGRPGSVFCG